MLISELPPQPAMGNDWVELHNPTSAPITLTDMYLSDDERDLMKYAIPPDDPRRIITIDAETGFHVADQDSVSGMGKGVVIPFARHTGKDRVAGVLPAQEAHLPGEI